MRTPRPEGRSMGVKRVCGISGVAMLASLLCLSASGPCVDEEAIREVEARRAALLADRLPKEELWTLIERRGRALEQTAELRRALEEIESRITAIEARTAELERAIEQAHARREAVGAEIDEASADRKRVAAELASVEGELRSLPAGPRTESGAP